MGRLWDWMECQECHGNTGGGKRLERDYGGGIIVMECGKGKDGSLAIQLSSWKEGMVVLIVKKGEGEKVENYRGVTVMAALYKIYVSVLEERLREEVEDKEIVPQKAR